MKENFKKESPLLGLEGSGGGLGFFGGAVAEKLTFGAESVFEYADTRWMSAVYDSSNNKVVVAYQDNADSERGKAVVGTPSGNGFSWGTPQTFSTDGSSYISATFDSNSNKVVICYQNTYNGYGRAKVGTVSGSSISFGSEATFEYASVNHISATFDSNSNKVVVAFRDQENNVYGTACVGTVSGTSISFGSHQVFSYANTYYMSATFDSNLNKVVLAYTSTSGYGYASVGTVSGTTISFGSQIKFQGDYTADNPSATFDSTNNKVVIAYKDSSNSSYGTAVVGTVSGTTISFGSKTVFESASVNYISPVFNSAKGKVVIGYRDDGNSSYGTAIVGEVSGTSISFGDDPVVFNAANSGYVKGAYMSTNERVVFVYRDVGNSSYGTAVTGGIG